MRTTLELPDDLFRKVKAKAAMEGATMKEMLTRFVESGLARPTPLPTHLATRSRLPVIHKIGKGVIVDLSPELQDKLEMEEDIARQRRSFRR